MGIAADTHVLGGAALARPFVIRLRCAFLYGTGVGEGDTAEVTPDNVSRLITVVEEAKKKGRITPRTARRELAALRDARRQLGRGDRVAAVINGAVDPAQEAKVNRQRRAARAAKKARKRNRR